MPSDSNRTLEKGLDMLFQFNERRPILTVKDMISLLDLPKSTAYRLLDTLKSKDLIQECGTGRYSLGLSILQLAKVATAGMDLIQIATPIMEDLSRETGETVILSGVVNNQAICIDRIESTQAIKLTFERGRLHPLHAGASAKVLLAFMNKGSQLNILNDLYEQQLIDDMDIFEQQLNKVHEQGFVISNAEIDPGAWAVAAPIFGSDGKLIAGLTVAGPKFRVDIKQEDFITDLLLSKVRQLSEKLKFTEINYI